MGLEMTGFVKEVFEAKQVSERFKKRELVVETVENPRYPQLVMFEASGDRCELFDHIKIGDEVRLEFSIRGREWRPPGGRESKYFNTLSVFAVTRVGAAADNRADPSSPGEVDDIPF